MMLKMAAPWRQTVEMSRSYIKVYCKHIQTTFYSKQSCEKSKYLCINPVMCDRKFMSTRERSEKRRLQSPSKNIIVFSCPRLFSTCSLDERKCWQCGAETNKKEELFFCNCGVVQEVPTDLNYFQVVANFYLMSKLYARMHTFILCHQPLSIGTLASSEYPNSISSVFALLRKINNLQAMGFEESFDIDVEKLSRFYKDLQKKLHPDKYSRKSEEEQSVADKQSAYINKAYTTLLRPLSRGLYVLELHGDPIEESNTSVDPEFLMLMMEVNEELSEHQHDVDIVRNLEKQNLECLNKCINIISDAFREKNLAEAKEHVIKLKYYTNIEEKIKEIHRHKMDRWTM